MYKNDPTSYHNDLIRRCGPQQALRIYSRSLLPSHSPPNKFTFTFLLKSLLRSPSPSLSLRFLPLLHCHVTLLGLHSDPFLLSLLLSLSTHPPTISSLFASAAFKDTVLRTALVSAYANCSLPDLARQAFDEIPHPNPVSWSALVSAYSRSRRFADALSAFARMRSANVPPNPSSLLSALLSASHLPSLRAGECIHSLSVRIAPLTPAISTATLSMYANCGRIEDSIRVFYEMTHRDTAAWTAMMSALASHGRGHDAVRMFDEMVESGVAPDRVAYVAVLQACGHAGMTDEAGERFAEMRRVYGIEPGAEHYGCMVDVLGRAGRVEEAWEVVRSMPVEPDEYVLKSLMSACCASGGFVEYAEWAAERLRRVDVRHASSYVMLSNVYGGMGRWEESARVRRLMREHGVRKSPGQSAVD